MTKTIMITGSTDGIGKIAALKLAKENHHVILHGRSKAKLAKVVEEMKKESGNNKISAYTADFSKLDEVSEMVNSILDEVSRIDVLINNAGVFKVSNPISSNGVDVRMVVNYFAPYVLTNKILTLLEKSEDPRVVNLSSAAQASVYTIFKSDRVMSDNEAYAQSKLAILMWSFHLAEQHPEMTVTALNPGSLLNTKMVQEAYGKFWSSADKGANIIVDLASNEKYKNVSGKYFDNDRGGFGPAHPDAYQNERISELISATQQILS